VNAARILPALLATMTLVVLLGNALPAVKRKHRLQYEERLLRVERHTQALRRVRLTDEHAALQSDPFFLERTYAETWATVPHGALEFEATIRPESEYAD